MPGVYIARDKHVHIIALVWLSSRQICMHHRACMDQQQARMYGSYGLYKPFRYHKHIRILRHVRIMDTYTKTTTLLARGEKESTRLVNPRLYPPDPRLKKRDQRVHYVNPERAARTGDSWLCVRL